jgi:SAM-dependent methyltransferase
VSAEPQTPYELDETAHARRLCDWMFDQYASDVRGRVAEIGAGIGTFSERILASGADSLLLVEPDPTCAAALEWRFGADPRVELSRDELPDAPALRGGGFDLVVCQNVLEHIRDDAAAVEAMAAALAPEGRLVVLVPAHPGLYGSLDRTYGHFRRYDRERLGAIVRGAGLEVVDLYSFNLLGVVGWWFKNLRPGSRVSARSLAAYELLVGVWRPVEERLRPRRGLSLIARARRS